MSLRLIALVILIAGLFAGCGGRDAPEATGTSTPATPTPGRRPVASLHDVDFSEAPFAVDLIRQAGGGEVAGELTRFADLVGQDGVDEAVVIVHSGGTAGEIGAGVYRLVGGYPELVALLRYNGRLELRRQLIVTVEGVYEPGDAECCPSRLRETTYEWDGSRFAVVGEQELPAEERG